MPSTTRLLNLRPALLLLVLAIVAGGHPSSAQAADPGDPVILADGTVLAPAPDGVAPTVHAEMLGQHGGATTAAATSDAPAAGVGSIAVTSTELESMEAASPLVEVAGGAIGPGGALPSGLQREVLGFLPYWMLDSTTRQHLRYDLVSTIAYFGIGVQSNGYLERGPTSARTPGWIGWTSAALTDVINNAHARGVKVVPTITMMAWNGDYSGMSQLLNSAEYRARLIDDVASVVGARNADGVNVDFEPVPTSLRSQFSSFVRELKAGLVARGVGSYLTVDTMAGAASWSTGYDVEALTAPGAADALMVMAYDFSWSGSARAGGVAPAESDYIFAAGDAMRAHLARVPASKLIWGVPYYGRAWNTTSDAQNSTVRSPAQSVAFSYYWTDAGAPAGGKILAERYGRRWDATGQVPWFSFTNTDGGWRQGYYDDPVSLAAKYDMVTRNGLAGVGIWTLGMDTGVDDLWNVIRSRFADSVTRLAGADRYATAAAISAASYPAGVPVAYVATGADYPDALAAGPAATRAGGPVLLVTASRIPAPTVLELQRLRPARIVVLGGPGVVSDGVLAALGTYAGAGGVHRLAGADRYATAAAVSAATFPAGAAVAYVSTGTAFPDALTGGVAAGREGGPLLLVQPNRLPAATAAELSRLRPGRIVVLGGVGAVNDGVLAALQPYATSGTVTRLAGLDRYETAIAVSQATTPGPVSTVYVATGRAFADGLAGSPPAARAGVPMLIVNPAGLSASVAAELRRLNPSRVVVLGGTGAVPEAVVGQINALWD